MSHLLHGILVEEALKPKEVIINLRSNSFARVAKAIN